MCASEYPKVQSVKCTSSIKQKLRKVSTKLGRRSESRWCLTGGGDERMPSLGRRREDVQVGQSEQPAPSRRISANSTWLALQRAFALLTIVLVFTDHRRWVLHFTVKLFPWKHTLDYIILVDLHLSHCGYYLYAWNTLSTYPKLPCKIGDICEKSLTILGKTAYTIVYCEATLLFWQWVNWLVDEARVPRWERAVKIMTDEVRRKIFHTINYTKGRIWLICYLSNIGGNKLPLVVLIQ